MSPEATPVLCPICQEEVADPHDPKRAVRLVPCGHVMHAQCARRWFAGSSSCPICRDAPVGPGALPPPLRRSSAHPTDDDVVYAVAIARLAEAARDLVRSLA